MPHRITRDVLLVGLLAGCAALLPAGPQPTTVTLSVPDDQLTGSVTLAFELPARRAQTLPAGTDRVDITLASDLLAKPIRQTITSAQFVDNRALMRVDKLPVGTVTVDASVQDSRGQVLVMGGAQATVRAGEITPVTLMLVQKAPSGSLAVAIDSRTETDTPVITIGKGLPSPARAVAVISPSNGWQHLVRIPAYRTVTLTANGRVGHRDGSNWDYYDANGCSSCPPGTLDGRFYGMALLGRLTPDDPANPVTVFYLGTGPRTAPDIPGELQVAVNTWTGGTFAGYLDATAVTE